MFEKMFTTKMSADKKKLQNRFSKIRSQNGKTSRIIAMVLFSLIVVSVIAVSVYIAVNKLQDDMSENPDVIVLYELKETYIGDASKVRKIVDLTNVSGYIVDSIELRTAAEPYGLDINFMVENRKNHRNIDENSLNRISGLIFSLVKNVDEIRYSFYDAYSDKNNKDDVFYGAYYNRENLCERINNSKITEGYIEASTVDYKTFEEYYNTLMSTEVAVQNSEFTDAVNEFIGEDYEVVVNSGFGTEIVIDDLSEADEKLLGEFFSRAIGKYSGVGITANLTVYDIRNFKTDEYGHCAFLHYTHPDEGLVMIGEKILNDGEYEEIRTFLIKKSSN